MPSTKVERHLTIVYEEDLVIFKGKINSLLRDGWKYLSSGCNSIPIVSKRNGKITTLQELV